MHGWSRDLTSTQSTAVPCVGLCWCLLGSSFTPMCTARLGTTDPSPDQRGAAGLPPCKRLLGCFFVVVGLFLFFTLYIFFISLEILRKKNVNTDLWRNIDL